MEYDVELHDEPDTNVPGVLNKAQMEALLDQAMEELPESQREVVEYRRQGLSFNEISDKTGENMCTLLSRMHYAVDKMRQIISAHIEK